MALVQCPECNKDVSDTAPACPHCGYSAQETAKPPPAPKEKTTGCAKFAAVILVVFVLAGILGNDDPAPTATTASKPLTRAEQIKKAFRPLGQHRELERYVKERLKDPDSYEHIKTVYHDRQDHLYLLMKYRAKNGFGGYTIGHHAGKAAIDGTLLVVSDCNTQTTDLCNGITEPPKQEPTPAPAPKQFYKWTKADGSTQYAPLTEEQAQKLNATRVEVN